MWKQLYWLLDACILRMGAVRNYSTNSLMEKNKTEAGGGGWGVKDMEFSGVL